MVFDRGRRVVPDCWKSGIGIAAAHVAAISLNCSFVEFFPAPVSDSLLRKELVVEELKVANGKLALLQRPGLAVELNQAAVAECAADDNCTPRDVAREEGLK